MPYTQSVLKDQDSGFLFTAGGVLIIGLYALFLGDVWVSSLRDVSGARYWQKLDSAGLLAVTSVTTTMGRSE